MFSKSQKAEASTLRCWMAVRKSPAVNSSQCTDSFAWGQHTKTREQDLGQYQYFAHQSSPEVAHSAPPFARKTCSKGEKWHVTPVIMRHHQYKDMTGNRGSYEKSLIPGSLTTNDNDYQMEQAADTEAAARRWGVNAQIIYADNDAITQSQQLLKVIQSHSDSHPDATFLNPSAELRCLR